MKTTRELLGARIKELRKRRGLTQEQLAEKVDLATRYISLIEVGRSSPSLETIENIANTLEVELKDLFDYMHLDPERVAPVELGKSLDEIDEPSRKLLYRIARLMAR
ncbi:helix-turn-helix domain-containing protein [Geobacter sp. SVR]|uniref:helix-turn-helix domain-containing protein n=1 Tax=Geobacter sp. SVR TaxID=2495594 RepID=UPI00143EF74B|nr:helix-turn-helix transcriptional regulator [Geobacter sp. SVR]BCS55620.1 hypothetical protein GSVR_39280 [Geobacter sp. SVR]GCF83623.1 hypothetical protein GSbR_02230 [Geobacter sp. SVR]